MRNCKKIK